MRKTLAKGAVQTTVARAADRKRRRERQQSQGGKAREDRCGGRPEVEHKLAMMTQGTRIRLPKLRLACKLRRPNRQDVAA
jgi:hypothetical protein